MHPDTSAQSREPATDAELAEVARLGWAHRGTALTRDLQFRDFDEAMEFAEHVRVGANDYFRRPDLLIRSGNLRLSVENLHHAGFTRAEIRLVHKASAVIEQYGKRGEVNHGSQA